MKIRILAFATAAEALGAKEIDIEIPEGTTVASLGEHVQSAHPSLAPLWPRLAIAVNGHLAQGDTVVPEGAEVALLPPVSGG